MSTALARCNGGAGGPGWSVLCDRRASCALYAGFVPEKRRGIEPMHCIFWRQQYQHFTPINPAPAPARRGQLDLFA